MTYPTSKKFSRTAVYPGYTLKAARNHGGDMKASFNIVGGMLVILGAIWLLQGINVLPGSFMTGQTQWAVYGGIAVAVGISLILASNRKRLDGRR
jgi:hypothetical protein